MTISFPSKPAMAIDTPEVRKLRGKFIYNFFVPDERLNKLTEFFNPKKVVYATIEVYDIPGLRRGEDGKLRISNAFLNEVNKHADRYKYKIIKKT